MNHERASAFGASREDQAQRFAERVVLARMTEEEAVASTKKEWRLVQRWVASNDMKVGSFLYMCDVFDLEPDSVRNAIKERK